MIFLNKINFSTGSTKHTSKDLITKKKIDISKITLSTGIKKRFRSKKLEDTIYLSLKAIKKSKILEKYKISGLIYVSQTSKFSIPATSSILQSELKLDKNIFVTDINQGCSGFIQALYMSKMIMKNDNKIKNLLIVCSDTYSFHINKFDHNVNSIFSDVSSCTLIKRTELKNIGNFTFGTDGKGSQSMYLFSSGFTKKKENIFMNGPAMLNFALRELPTAFFKICKINNIKKDDIDFFILHQASKKLLEAICEKLNFDKKKMIINLESIGNTTSSSIPITIYNLMNKKALKKNHKILLLGFGVGFSWGGVIINL